jgi:hypothetical protein
MGRGWAGQGGLGKLVIDWDVGWGGDGVGRAMLGRLGQAEGQGGTGRAGGGAGRKKRGCMGRGAEASQVEPGRPDRAWPGRSGAELDGIGSIV